MRAASADIAEVLTGAVESVEYVADVLSVTGLRLAQDVPLTDVQFTFDAAAEVEFTGKATIVRVPDADGASWVPNGPGDLLAPFGRELSISVLIKVGPMTERVQIGVVAITEVPAASQTTTTVRGVREVLSETITVEFADRMDDIRRARFERVTAVTYPGSAWMEISAVSGFEVVRSLPDVPVGAQTPYEDDRVKAVQSVARLLGGDAYFTPNGFLSVRPFMPGAPVATLTVGEYGTLSPLRSPLSRDGVYNVAVVRGKSESSSAPVQGTDFIRNGALSVQNYRRVPSFYQSDFLTAQSQVDAEARRLLERRSVLRAREYEAVVLWNPLLQVGDVVNVEEAGVESRQLQLTRIEGASSLMAIRGVLV